MTNVYCSVVGWFGLIATAYGAGYPPPVLQLPLMSHPPTIDGTIHKKEWMDADSMQGFVSGSMLAPQQATFWIGITKKRLYVAVRSQTPPGGRLLARVNPVQGMASLGTVLLDDCVELLVEPHGVGQDRGVYRVIFNAKGVVWGEIKHLSGVTDTWLHAWTAASKVIGNRWNFEASVPWRDLGVAATPSLNQPIGIRVVRIWQQTTGPRVTSWFSPSPVHQRVAVMPRVKFDRRAPIVQTLRLKDPKTNTMDVKMSIRNTYDSVMTVRTTIKINPPKGQHVGSTKLIQIPPGRIRTIQVKQPASFGIERLNTELLVSSVDSEHVYYRRRFMWTLTRPHRLWTTNENIQRAISTSFAFYPYHHRLKVIVNTRGLASSIVQVKSVKLMLEKKNSDRIVASTIMPPLIHQQTKLAWHIPALDRGVYLLIVAFPDVAIPHQSFQFIRHKFPWEHNRLGKSNVVVRPFTPIQVQGHKVETVLRDHEINSIGLWRQVTALNKNLLAGPMRLEVTSGGKTWQARGSHMDFTQKTSTRVRINTDWSAGPLKGKTIDVWDYDGMMKSTIVLGRTHQPIQSVRLVIPLKNRLMPLFHAVTDGIRFNYAGAIPKGRGVIWRSSQAPRHHIIGSYVPYVWVGGTERGVSVFGENDYGWVTSDNVPTQELIRIDGDTLQLQLNLVAKPITIARPRRITIGFLATPIKPMPEGWRGWIVNGPKDNPKRTLPEHLDVAFVGACIGWGSLNRFAGVYPRERDFSIYNEFAKTRRSGFIDHDFLKKWLAGYHALGRKSDVVQQNIDAHRYTKNITSAFRRMATRPEAVIVYTNGSAMQFFQPAGQTFLDPWTQEAFPTRYWLYGQKREIDADPVESYRDRAVWYYKKMLSTFADSIYWDNMFPRDDFDTVGTAAYQEPNGVIQPSSEIFEDSQLVRRTAVLLQEMGKADHDIVHMTNGAVAPILAFAGADLSWEFHYGDADFQDRFSRTYIQTVSIGRQFGNVPLVLVGIRGHNKAKKKRARHTAVGVLLSNELIPLGFSGEYSQDFERLIKFGYGTQNVKVWNYWQQHYPLKITGDKTSSILLAKPKHILMVICDYGNGGNITIRLDAKRLGLTGHLSARNVVNGKNVRIYRNGEIQFPLAKHDFIIVEVSVGQDERTKTRTRINW